MAVSGMRLMIFFLMFLMAPFWSSKSPNLAIPTRMLLAFFCQVNILYFML